MTLTPDYFLRPRVLIQPHHRKRIGFEHVGARPLRVPRSDSTLEAPRQKICGSLSVATLHTPRRPPHSLFVQRPLLDEQRARTQFRVTDVGTFQKHFGNNRGYF
jgi:hypothetical protein